MRPQAWPGSNAIDLFVNIKFKLSIRVSKGYLVVELLIKTRERAISPRSIKQFLLNDEVAGDAGAIAIVNDEGAT